MLNFFSQRERKKERKNSNERKIHTHIYVYIYNRGGYKGGGRQAFCPPPEQDAVVLFLISNYENALQFIRR